MRFTSLIPLIFATLTFDSAAADWVRAGINTNASLWGLRGGLLRAISPGCFRGSQGFIFGITRQTQEELGFAFHPVQPSGPTSAAM